MTQISLNDLFSQEARRNPYPFYARMREQGPLSHFTWGGREMWVVMAYDDAVAMLKDPRLTLDQQKVESAQDARDTVGGAASSTAPYVPLAWTRHLLNTDPPDHTRLRNLVSKAFTPRMIEQLRPRIQTITDELIDAVQVQGQMDLIADFAFPLPIIVISEMLGIPTAHRQQFRDWTQAIIQGQQPAITPESAAVATTAEEEFVAYIKTMIARKRAYPDNDLTSNLVQAEEKGDALSEDELVSMIFLLITAGHETTVNLIGNGMLALLEHSEQMNMLRTDPTLLPSAIEELLRYVTPVSFSAPRWATEDIILHGQAIHKGDMVRCSLLAASTDPQQFSDPELLDILRRENQHIAFGKGIHYCLGAPLARLEGQIAVGTLLRRLPLLHLASAAEQLIWRDTGFLRSLAALPVMF